MTIVNQLASALERRDEQPNIELAEKIANTSNHEAVGELIKLLGDKKKLVQNDCIKVLYEIGGLKPGLIAPYYEQFVALLTHKNNRLQWGAMTALSTIVSVNPQCIYDAITEIIDAADHGSVITKDNAVKILVQLCAEERYADSASVLLNEQLLRSAVNQLPMYAELAVTVVNDSNRDMFANTLRSRLADVDQESKKKRIEKVLKKIAG